MQRFLKNVASSSYKAASTYRATSSQGVRYAASSKGKSAPASSLFKPLSVPMHAPPATSSAPQRNYASWSLSDLFSGGSAGPQPAPSLATPAAPATARQEMTEEELEQIMRNKEHMNWVVHRTSNENVAKNGEIQPMQQTLSTAPEYTYFARGIEGLNYGDWHVLVPKDEAAALPVEGREPEVRSTRNIPAGTGRWVHNSVVERVKAKLAAEKAAALAAKGK